MKLFENKDEINYKNKIVPNIALPAVGEINNKKNYYFIVNKEEQQFKLTICDDSLKIGFSYGRPEVFYFNEIYEVYNFLYKLYPEKSPRLLNILKKLQKIKLQKIDTSFASIPLKEFKKQKLYDNQSYKIQKRIITKNDQGVFFDHKNEKEIIYIPFKHLRIQP